MRVVREPLRSLRVHHGGRLDSLACRNEGNSLVHIERSVFREDHEMFRATVRRFLERECVPRQSGWDKAGRVDRETWL